MESSSSSYKTFWRKPLTRRFRHIYRTLAVIAACLLFVVPTFLSWSVLNDFNKNSELAELLENENKDINTVKVVKTDLKKCNQLEARLETVNPDSNEYESIKGSCDTLKQEVAGTMPSLVEGYDEYGVPILMTYQEYMEKNNK